jgi:uncharacterized protein YyaL (SSP411 family)
MQDLLTALELPPRAGGDLTCIDIVALPIAAIDTSSSVSGRRAPPSGNSVIAKQLLRLAAYTGDVRYDEAARQTLSPLANALREYPQAFGEAMNAVDMLVNGVAEVAIVGDPSAEATNDLLHVVTERYRPNVIVALAEGNVDGETTIPLLNYRTQRNGQPTVYVCHNFACRMPVTTPDDMRGLL